MDARLIFYFGFWFFCFILFFFSFGVSVTNISHVFLISTLQVDAALIATGRSPFTKGLGLEKVSHLFNSYKDNLCILIIHGVIKCIFNAFKICHHVYVPVLT